MRPEGLALPRRRLPGRGLPARGLLLRRALLEAGHRAREVGGLADRAHAGLEDLGLRLHEHGGLLERLRRLLERLRLPAERRATLLEQVEDGFEGREGVPEHLALEAPLPLEDVLDEIGLALQRAEQLLRDDGLHGGLPVAQEVEAAVVGHHPMMSRAAEE